ncbi:MAG: hypothetical protein HQK86_09900 [Nitrospinae bacterium]|nr:hypothetical protein [Nitrospinota bacterium]
MSDMKKYVSTALFTLVFALAACTGGGGEAEDKYAQALASVNPAFKIAEMKQEKDKTVIRVEVEDDVKFAEGKKVAEAIQKADPKFAGYVEFFNSQVGMVIRKVEITPAT